MQRGEAPPSRPPGTAGLEAEEPERRRRSSDAREEVSGADAGVGRDPAGRLLGLAVPTAAPVGLLSAHTSGRAPAGLAVTGSPEPVRGLRVGPASGPACRGPGRPGVEAAGAEVWKRGASESPLSSRAALSLRPAVRPALRCAHLSRTAAPQPPLRARAAAA